MKATKEAPQAHEARGADKSESKLDYTIPRQLSVFGRAAIEYAGRGWHVFPCVTCGRRPITQHGFKDATTDPDQIRRWWTDRPNANIAIATGKVSGLIVVDIDPRNGGNESVADLEHSNGPFPETLTVPTPRGGRHLYYTLEGVLHSCTPLPGIDIKANGGYVIAPPSADLMGNRYEWN